MSDTPRTDAVCGWPWGHHGRIECGDLMHWSPDGPFVHSCVARELERENTALRERVDAWKEEAVGHGAKLHALEYENARLQMELDASCNAEEMRQVRAENAALRKEKDRLDWLITSAPFCVLSTLSSDPVAARLKIDREMEFPTV